MKKVCSLRQPSHSISLSQTVLLRQAVPLQEGDWVRYVGSNLKIQQDYGNQDLRITAIDLLNGIAVCDTKIGSRLVGVALHELHKLR
ncbi:MAG: hypothetical protein HC895_02655, partial [Leptolyngbyaceae cyanobacterium SM1_3_5]|nr:hypothetical protein [Leptolyngbyaceae cyanobacterium SM1_3_5]